MAEWLQRVSQGHETYCYDLEVMGSNPSRIELRANPPPLPPPKKTKEQKLERHFAGIASTKCIYLVTY